MDEKRDKASFWHELEKTSGRYPNQKFESRHNQAYWMALQLLELQDVTAGLASAADASPKFMPSATLIREHSIRHERDRKMRDEVGQVGSASDQPDMWNNPAARVPDKQAYIDAGDSDYERFARQCEVDSMRVMTREEQHERVRKFNEIVGRIGAE
jgi:hypothetical protein